MYDCSADVRAFHNQEVTLPESERKKMRSRRDSNRVRLDGNLEKDDKPVPYEHVSQGSCRSTLIKEKLPLLAYFGDFCASI